MAASLRRWRLPGLIAAVFITCGCNLSGLTYFLFNGKDVHPPECAELAAPAKEIKILILASLGTEVRPEFLRTDRDVSDALARLLRERYKINQDKITIVPPNQVESFKDKNPAWHTMDVQEIGDRFHADFVINLELDKLSLYEPRSMNELFRGQGEVSVSVFDAHKPGEGPVFRREFSFQYPVRGPKPVMDANNPAQFRAEFLAYMVKELSRCFASYTMDQKYACEE
jgi:hypothetical protein